MPEIVFELPAGVSRVVFESDLSCYFGRDAQIVERKGTHYVIDASSRLNQQSMIRMLQDDTTRWRKSDQYNQIDYSQSHVHQDRKRSMNHGRESHGSRRDSNVTGTVTSAMPIPAKRPSMPHRYSSNNGSVIDSAYGSSYQSTQGYSHSSMYSSQSRRPSETVISGDPLVRSRTMSVSSNSSDYGTEGYYGWRTGHGTDGYYGWKQDGSSRK